MPASRVTSVNFAGGISARGRWGDAGAVIRLTFGASAFGLCLRTAARPIPAAVTMTTMRIDHRTAFPMIASSVGTNSSCSGDDGRGGFMNGRIGQVDYFASPISVGRAGGGRKG